MTIAADILGHNDLPRAPIEIPEWPGGPYFVRAITGAELRELRTIDADKEPEAAMAAMVQLCLVDADGSQVFAIEHRAALMDKNTSVLKRVAEAAIDLCGLSEEGRDELGKG